jgi:acyl dehydratase
MRGDAVTASDRQRHQVADLAGFHLGRRVAAYREEDAILYAVAVGARAQELELVYERKLRVLPTYALALGLWGVEAAGATGAYDPLRTLHVGQRLDVHEPLPPSGEVEMEAHVAAVWDKGSAALLEVAVSSPFFDATYDIWVPGAGGFGGERGTSARQARAGDPELRLTLETSPQQAALYRLTGDRHALHIDPDIAAEAGFERPILHGLCLLGAASLALARGLGEEPTAISQLAARFAAPVYPGTKIALAVWPGAAGDSSFSARAGEAEVLKEGRIRFGAAG